MENRGVLTKILATLGTALVWFPILAPVVLTVAFSMYTGRFRFDYLMPAELFPAALAGGILLFWAALRAHAHAWLIGLSVGSAAVLLVGSQGLAVVTGLASGVTATGGWQWALVLALLAGYVLAVLGMGVGGVLLLRDLFRRPRRPEHAW